MRSADVMLSLFIGVGLYIRLSAVVTVQSLENGGGGAYQFYYKHDTKWFAHNNYFIKQQI